MGYTHETGQKGYKVRRLEDGKMLAVAPERLYKCFEFSLCYGPPPNYDAWLRRSIERRDKKVRNATLLDNSDIVIVLIVIMMIVLIVIMTIVMIVTMTIVRIGRMMIVTIVIVLIE